MELKKLQNGSDIRGIGVEIDAPVNLTDEAVYAIANAFVAWLDKEDACIAIGRDSRVSGERIVAAAVRGMTDAGANVINVGMASTPAMFMTTVTDGWLMDGAVMITASHLPMDRNGLKFFINKGGLEKQDIAEIIDIAEKGVSVAEAKGTEKCADFMSVYAEQLCDKIRAGVGGDKPLHGIKIVVDAGNGAGGFFVEKVLVPLGADTTGSQFLEPDGTFPNHIPNPENAGAMQATTDAVLKAGADIGIVFDTDVDRAGAVDRNGNGINRNKLIALLAAMLLEETPGTTIVTDSVTSDGLAKFIAAKGGIHHRFKRGYKNVINEAIRLNEAGQDAQMAIETSGHGALKENYFLDDGAYLMTKLIIKLAQMKKQGEDLFAMLDELDEPLESAEFRLGITEEDFKAYGMKVLEEVTKKVNEDDAFEPVPENYEGIRVNVGKGWFLLRMSLHEPLMPLNIESDEEGGADKIRAMVYDLLKGFEGLNTSTLA